MNDSTLARPTRRLDGRSRPLELRCEGCGFLLVVNDVPMAEQMRWQALNPSRGTGRCARCSGQADD